MRNINYLLKILACPVCKKDLIKIKNNLKCVNCKRTYSIESEIPLMIPKDL